MSEISSTPMIGKGYKNQLLVCERILTQSKESKPFWRYIFSEMSGSSGFLTLVCIMCLTTEEPLRYESMSLGIWVIISSLCGDTHVSHLGTCNEKINRSLTPDGFMSGVTIRPICTDFVVFYNKIFRFSTDFFL